MEKPVDKKEKPDKKKEKPDVKKGREMPENTTGGVHPAFLVQNPIATPLGPVGEFLQTPDALPMFPSVVLFGQRRTGKSFSLRELMYNCFRNFNFGIVLSDTACNGFWQEVTFISFAAF